MRFIVLRHQDEEGLGTTAEWLQEKGYSQFYVNLTHRQKPPTNSLTAYDALIVMGGNMSANDDSWIMNTSRALTADFVQAGRPVLGICLGAQSIAKVMGATVSPSVPEHGFSYAKPVLTHPFFKSGTLDTNPWDVFQWHRETFTLPNGFQKLFEGDTVSNQAFTYKNALGLQFHIEMSYEWYAMWQSCHALRGQSTHKLDAPTKNMPFAAMKKNYFALLDCWVKYW
ncbi:MAG TPA: type 1 glutamine amidotransferase [Turneriella sp.]|nr:type 1 glutamine amidotransferase [Turneriella sp.]